MSVQSEIDRIITAVGNAYSKVSEKGGTVPASQTVANLATAIDSIPSGGGAPNLQSKALTITSNGTVSVTPDAPYDALKKVDVTVNVASGGGGSAGFKVTFPATASNWNKLYVGYIIQADGTWINMVNYSTLAGKTIHNVVEIAAIGVGSYDLMVMTVQTGKIMTANIETTSIFTHIAADGESSYTWMGNGLYTRWIPLKDTVISSIEMYNTD